MEETTSKRGRPKGLTKEAAQAAYNPLYKEVMGYCSEMGITVATMATKSEVPASTINLWRKSGSGRSVQVDAVRAVYREWKNGGDTNA